MFGRYRLDRNGSARKREATSLGRRIFNGLGNALSAVALTGSLAAGVAAFAPTSYADEITQDQSMTQPVDNNTQVADTTPAPVVDTTPAPVVDTTPAPVVDTTPAPVVDTTPAPVVDTTPAPVVDTTPAPVVDTTPAPVVDTTPAPVVDTTPAPVVDTTPAPVVDTTSVSVDETAPVAETTSVDETASVDDTTPVADTASVDDITPVADTTSVDETTPVADTASVDDTTPVADTTSVDDITPVADTTSVDDTTPVADTTSVDDTTPVADTTSVDDTTPVADTTSVDDTTPVADTTSVDENTNNEVTTNAETKEAEQTTPSYTITGDGYTVFVKDGVYNIVGNISEDELADLEQTLYDKYGIDEYYLWSDLSQDQVNSLGDTGVTVDTDDKGNLVISGDNIDSVSELNKDGSETVVEANEAQNNTQGGLSYDIPESYETDDYKYNYDLTVSPDSYQLFGNDGKYDLVLGGVGLSAGQIQNLVDELKANGVIPENAEVNTQIIPDYDGGREVDLSFSGNGNVMYHVQEDGSYTISSDHELDWTTGHDDQLEDNYETSKDPDAEPDPDSKPNNPDSPTPSEPEPTPSEPEPTPSEPEPTPK